MLVPLSSVIRVDPRRDAPRLEYARHDNPTHDRYRRFVLKRYTVALQLPLLPLFGPIDASTLSVFLLLLLSLYRKQWLPSVF